MTQGETQDRLDELEAQLDAYEQRLDDHETTLGSVREHLDDSVSRERSVASPSGIAAGGLLAALGLTAATGTASADPTGQIGTADRPVETVYAAALEGPVTDDRSLESLVGDGLDIQDGQLTLAGGD